MPLWLRWLLWLGVGPALFVAWRLTVPQSVIELMRLGLSPAALTHPSGVFLGVLLPLWVLITAAAAGVRIVRWLAP